MLLLKKVGSIETGSYRFKATIQLKGGKYSIPSEEIITHKLQNTVMENPKSEEEDEWLTGS
jgi:hypothetical protein